MEDILRLKKLFTKYRKTPVINQKYCGLIYEVAYWRKELWTQKWKVGLYLLLQGKNL